jgi:hypothetical protein
LHAAFVAAGRKAWLLCREPDSQAHGDGSRVILSCLVVVPPCPNCESPAPRELDVSRIATINWTAHKKTHAVLTHVTPLKTNKPVV